MLNVNSASSATGGKGNTTIASTPSTPTGTPMPAFSRLRIEKPEVAEASAMD
jgi:hypothetical protein